MFGSRTEHASPSRPFSPQGSSSPAPSAKDSPGVAGFSLGKRGILVFFTLSVLTLMVALDGTSISVALPVRINQAGYLDERSYRLDHLSGPERISH